MRRATGIDSKPRIQNRGAGATLLETRQATKLLEAGRTATLPASGPLNTGVASTL